MGLFGLFRRTPPLAGAADLGAFIDSRTAFIVQKCIFEYARARSGILSPKLFKEPAFRAAVEESRWRNYPLCLQSTALMVEHALRPHAGDRAGMVRQGLIAIVGDICRIYPVPDGFPADFWAQANIRIRRRIDQAGLAAPHAIKDLPRETAREFFGQLPIHADLRSYDRELVTNNLRANLCRAHEDFLASADVPALIHALITIAEEAREDGGL